MASALSAGIMVPIVTFARMDTESMTAVKTVLAVVATYTFLWALLHFTQDPKEPPLKLTAIPFISPILSMNGWGLRFCAHMKEQDPNIPIYTLRVPGGTRLYVVNSTELVQPMQRNPLLTPIQVQTLESVRGISKAGAAMLPGFRRAQRAVLEPGGSGLASIASVASERVVAAMDSLVERAVMGSSSRMQKATVDLYEWVDTTLFMATTDAVFGPGNPMRKPGIVEDWKTYSDAILNLLLTPPFLSFLLRDAIHARERIVSAFINYETTGQVEHGSPLVQTMQTYFSTSGLPPTDIARFHLAEVFSVTFNTLPAAFWVLFRLFAADTDILRTCREEAARCVTETAEEMERESVEDEGDDGSSFVRVVATLDAAKVKSDCPTLVAMYHETLRFHGMSMLCRVVEEDCMLDGQFLVRKGGIIMAPGCTQQRSREVWGEHVDVFDHTRFLKEKGAASGRRHNPVALRPFGDGSTMCPGEHLATYQILVMAALMILRFDARLVGSHGVAGEEWVMPTVEKSSQVASIEQPDWDVNVELTPRKEALGKVWRVSFEGGQEEAVADDL